MDFVTFTVDQFAALDADDFATLPLEDSSSSSSESSPSSSSSPSSVSSSHSSPSSGSSRSSSSSSQTAVDAVEQPRIVTARTYETFTYGDNVIVRGKPITIEIGDLDPDATIKLYADGTYLSSGTITSSTTVTFPTVTLPIGRHSLRITQERDGDVSTLSEPLTVRVSSVENVTPTLPPPTISPNNEVLFDHPVTVTITSGVEGAEVFYCTNGAGWARPVRKYEGPFQIDQSKTVRACAVYRGVKSAVVKTTIRIIR